MQISQVRCIGIDLGFRIGGVRSADFVIDEAQGDIAKAVFFFAPGAGVLAFDAGPAELEFAGGLFIERFAVGAGVFACGGGWREDDFAPVFAGPFAGDIGRSGEEHEGGDRDAEAEGD